MTDEMRDGQLRLSREAAELADRADRGQAGGSVHRPDEPLEVALVALQVREPTCAAADRLVALQAVVPVRRELVRAVARSAVAVHAGDRPVRVHGTVAFFTVGIGVVAVTAPAAHPGIGGARVQVDPMQGARVDLDDPHQHVLAVPGAGARGTSRRGS
mgnify:CR=1 FL=1